MPSLRPLSACALGALTVQLIACPIDTPDPTDSGVSAEQLSVDIPETCRAEQVGDPFVFEEREELSAETNALGANVATALNEANHCEVRSDCVELSGETPLCGTVFVNADAEQSDLVAQVNEFHDAASAELDAGFISACFGDCPNCGEVDCVDSRCTKFHIVESDGNARCDEHECRFCR